MNNPLLEKAESDRDTLYSMPLSILPLQTPALMSARMIKNAKLDTMVEVFSSVETGSGQLAVRDLPAQFGWEDPAHPDMLLLQKLGALPSYDVYSLRLSLRDADVSVGDIDELRLSPEKSAELATYMTSFTRPLIQQIYGDESGSDITSFEDVLALFRSPDIKNALDRLKQMADKLEVRPEQVPSFLEDYGDIFMALSYYRQCLDSIEPIISDFLESLRDIRGSYQFKEDRGLILVTQEVEATLNEAMAGLTGRFEAFDRASDNLWHDISADQFKKVEALIRGYHTTNGGVLCALWVKMNAWATAFPTKDTGSPGKRVELIQTELKHGMAKISKLERSAPKLDSLN